jgi:protein SCO1/2
MRAKKFTTIVLGLSLMLSAACHKAPPNATPAPCPCSAHGMHSDGAMGDGAPCHEHGAEPLPVLQPLPGSSVYQLTSSWENQNGETVSLARFRGQPTVVLMFYGTCQAVCPILIGDMKRIDEALAPDIRAHTQFLLVTFDPDTDTPARLLALAHERGLDTSRWSLLHGRADDVRDLAMALGFQYRPMGNGQFSHSNLITLLDANGIVAYQLEGVRMPIDEMVRRVSGAVSPPAH